MSKPNMSAITLALIEETEQEALSSIPLTQAFLELTLSRATDQAGQPIPHRFICSTELNGRIISAVAGKRMPAHNSLQKQIRMLGFEPMWTAVRDMTIVDGGPDEEPEEQVVQAEESEIEETPVEEPEEAGEHEDPVYGLVVDVPVLDKWGWLTPLSDPLAYKRVYLAAWKLALGLSVYNIADLTAESRDVRASIAAVMMSGDAGESVGIPAKAVNPWALGTNGQQEMCWVRVLKGTPDPTTKPFRAGSGEAREAYLTTLSGLAAFPEKADAAREWREKRAARSFVGTRNATTVGAKNIRNDKRSQAHAAGSASKTKALESGLGIETAELHYKWIYCATMRVLGEIHSEFERQLAAADVTEEQIIAVVEQMKGQKVA